MDDPIGKASSDLQAILQKLPSPLTIADMADPDHAVVAANAAFIGLTGYPLEAIVGRNCRFLQADLDNAAARAEIREALGANRRAQVILRNRRADGSEFHNFLTVVPILAAGTGPARYSLGAQFMMTEEEVRGIGATGGARVEHDVGRAVAEHRSLLFERRRMSIEAAIRIVESTLLLSQVRRPKPPARRGA